MVMEAQRVIVDALLLVETLTDLIYTEVWVTDTLLLIETFFEIQISRKFETDEIL